jgi:hypothetical protein
MHLQSHDPVTFSDFEQLLDMINLRLGIIFEEENPNLENASMILELSIALILDVCHRPDCDWVFVISEEFCKFLEFALFNSKYYSKSIIAEFLLFLNELFLHNLWSEHEVHNNDRRPRQNIREVDVANLTVKAEHV